MLHPSDPNPSMEAPGSWAKKRTKKRSKRRRPRTSQSLRICHPTFDRNNLRRHADPGPSDSVPGGTEFRGISRTLHSTRAQRVRSPPSSNSAQFLDVSPTHTGARGRRTARGVRPGSSRPMGAGRLGRASACPRSPASGPVPLSPSDDADCGRVPISSSPVLGRGRRRPPNADAIPTRCWPEIVLAPGIRSPQNRPRSFPTRARTRLAARPTTQTQTAAPGPRCSRSSTKCSEPAREGNEARGAASDDLMPFHGRGQALPVATDRAAARQKSAALRPKAAGLPGRRGTAPALRPKLPASPRVQRHERRGKRPACASACPS